VDDMVAANRLLYGEDEHPDHVVVREPKPHHTYNACPRTYPPTMDINT
jgi:hypothetical protein